MHMGLRPMRMNLSADRNTSKHIRPLEIKQEETQIGRNGRSQMFHLQLQEFPLLWIILPERTIGGRTR